MTHRHDLGKFRKNNGKMEMSASKRKSGSEVEENRVKQAGGPGAESHRQGRIRGTRKKKPQALMTFPICNMQAPFHPQLRDLTPALFSRCMSGRMPNDTTLNPVFSKASPRTLSGWSIRIHWELVVNGQNNMMSNIRNVMYHINYFQGLSTSSKESMSGSPFSSDPVTDILSSLF